MEAKRKLSVLSGSILLVNSMFGAGIISLPGCFVRLGLAGALCVLGLALLLTFVSLVFLAYSAEVSQNFSYAGLCREVGTPLAVVLDVAVMFICYGATLSYGLYMTAYIRDLLPSTAISSNELVQRAVIGLALLMPLFFLAKLRSLNKLRFVSWLTIAATVLVVAELLFYTFASGYRTANRPAAAWNNVLNAEGIALLIFSLGCHQNAMTIYAELTDRSVAGAVKTMGLGCVLAGAIYATIGFLGARLFGAFPEDNFLKIFTNANSDFIRHVKRGRDAHGILPRVCALAFIVVLFGALPIQSFAARNALFSLLRRKTPSKKGILAATLVQFAVIYACILRPPKAENVLALIGILGNPTIAFVLPAIVLMRIVGYRSPAFYAAGAMLALSVAVSGYSLCSFVGGLVAKPGAKAA